MENTNFGLLENIIKSRRTTGWAKMNGNSIPSETVQQILSLADWAPTHGRTEPWRFFVYHGESLKNFSKDHADLYWQHTAEDKRNEATFEKLLHNTDKVSHLIIAVMQRGINPKIPQLEEIAATAAALQNILLGATVLGIASFWSTGGMTLQPALKDYLKLSTDDQVMGMIYLGYSDEPPKDGVKAIPMSEKAKWL